jgi:multiple sugar transport system permease protein
MKSSDIQVLRLRRRPPQLSEVLIHLVLIVGLVFILLPFVWIVSTSLKTGEEILSIPPTIVPQHPTLRNFDAVITIQQFPLFILNSFIISTLSMLSVLVTSVLGGYAFAKFRFPLKNLLFVLILTTAIVPFEVYMVSVYVTVGRLQLFDNYVGIVFPILIMSFGVFFLRQFTITIPNQLLDAARVDGASEFWILLRVVVPLSITPLMALGIFAFSEAWAFFIWPLIIVNTKSMYTIELGLMVFHKKFYMDHGPIAAGAVVSVLPMLIVFLLLRRRFVQGVTLSGMKA